MKNKAMALVGLLIAGFILAGSVSAFGMGGMMKMRGNSSTLVSDEIRTQLDQAITNNDYESFKLIQSTNFPNSPTLSAEQFAFIVAQHQFHENVEAAIQSGNYEEWKTLLSQEDNPHSTYLLSKITADNFHLLKEWHEAQSRMETIQEELGFSPHAGGMKIMGHGKGMKPLNMVSLPN
jgi:hypothetical protein